MKRFVFLLAGFVFFSTSGWANDLDLEFNSNSNNWKNNKTRSFIFMENGIEFSVFPDGQFDFFMPTYGPNVSVGFSTSNASFSFNSGYNYNPYVQYDNYGSVIQIQNTPIFYDHYGRIQQVGNIYIDYNSLGRVNRIGGLKLFYRNNTFWRQRGFVNHINRRYVWRPWHSYYARPAAQFCLISQHPYRQFYTPVRHTYYRPYRNNNRHFAINRQDRNYRSHANTGRSQRYVQTPRPSSERNIRSNVQRRQTEMNTTRNSRISNKNNSNRVNSRAISEERNRNHRYVNSRGARTQVSSRTNRSRNHKSISQNSKKTEQARTYNRKTNDDSRRDMAKTKQRSNNKTASKAERSSRPGNGRSSRHRQ